MEARKIASLVEFSEARAYRSLVQAAPAAFLEQHGFKAVMFGSAVAVVAPSVTNTLNLNRVIGLGVDEPASPEMLDAIAELYERHGVPYGIEVAPCAQPGELPNWLRRRRLRRTVGTAMIFRAAEAVPRYSGPVAVVRACGEEQEIVADICCTVFRMPPVVRTLIANLGGYAGWRQWLAYLGPEPVAAGLSYVGEEVAWIGWAATLPEYRGHGCHMALVAHQSRDAADTGCRYITAETAVSTAVRRNPAYQNCEKLGFLFAYERATYVALRSAS